MAENKEKDHHHDETVTIKIDGTDYPITKGEHTVVEIKTLGNVPLAYELDEIKGKKPHPLPDDGKTNIHGDEVFVGHPRGSGSSSD